MIIYEGWEKDEGGGGSLGRRCVSVCTEHENPKVNFDLKSILDAKVFYARCVFVCVSIPVRFVILKNVLSINSSKWKKFLFVCVYRLYVARFVCVYRDTVFVYTLQARLTLIFLVVFRTVFLFCFDSLLILILY